RECPWQLGVARRTEIFWGPASPTYTPPGSSSQGVARVTTMSESVFIGLVDEVPEVTIGEPGDLGPGQLRLVFAACNGSADSEAGERDTDQHQLGEEDHLSEAPADLGSVDRLSSGAIDDIDDASNEPPNPKPDSCDHAG